MVTISEVAKEAGVSTATVSYALSKKRYVSPDLQLRVEAAIERLNYRPNVVAKGLKLNKSFTIGAVMSDFQNPFFSMVAKGIRDYCFEKKYGMVLGDTYEDPERVATIMDVFLGRQLDGAIVAPIGIDAHELDSFRKNGIPFVLINRTFEGCEDPHVVIDNQDSSFSMIRYLLACGHERIAGIFGPLEYVTSRARRAGFEQAFADSGLEAADDLIAHCMPDMDAAFQTALSLLQLKPRPTVLYAGNTIVAMGAFAAISKCGLAIPDDISFAALTFDGAYWVRIVTPSPTVMYQPAYQIGKEAAEVLFDLMHGRDRGNHQRVLKAQLVAGDSVRRLA